MAFISLVFIAIFLILCVLWIAGLILIIIGLCVRARHKKQSQTPIYDEMDNVKVVKKPKSPIVLSILGALMMAPVTFIVVVSIIGNVQTSIRNEGILGQQIKNGTVADVERLLKAGVNPEGSRDGFEENIVAEDGEYTWLDYLCYENNIPDYAEKMQLLIDYGADVNRRTYWCEYTPQDHMSDAYDADTGYNDGCGETPLMKACAAGSYDAVKVLIENGADVNAQDYCGKTALVYTVHYGHSSSGEDVQVEIAKLLLDNGAERNVSSRYSGTALEEAREREMKKLEQVLLEY
ncbi:MAG: ankyrin repeat domain-containing protein [Lachnospiraceae bacterium]|nr:ankyrin repeat domain-containing protein [Lachnospiraceae bacterium]